jgi:glutamate 5-kinase
VPVINENDSVATAEIRFGDNDRLAGARGAGGAGAGGGAAVRTVDGLYDRDPTQQGAQLLPRVEGVTDDVHAMASGSSARGSARAG